jgi:hypothetical protein
MTDKLGDGISMNNVNVPRNIFARRGSYSDFCSGAPPIYAGPVESGNQYGPFCHLF